MILLLPVRNLPLYVRLNIFTFAPLKLVPCQIFLQKFHSQLWICFSKKRTVLTLNVKRIKLVLFQRTVQYWHIKLIQNRFNLILCFVRFCRHYCPFGLLNNRFFQLNLFFSPDLIDETFCKICAILFICLQVRPVNDIVEKNGHLKDSFILFGQFVVAQLRSLCQFPKQTVDMMIGVVKPPVLTVIFYNNVPPFLCQ